MEIKVDDPTIPDKCVPCPSFCLECPQNNELCEKCQVGYVLYEGECDLPENFEQLKQRVSIKIKNKKEKEIADKE